VTELEILRRRRELVLLSAELQRATVVRRLDNVGRHPVNAVVGLATSAVSVPILIKVGSLVAGRLLRRARSAPRVKPRKSPSFLRLLPALRYVPVAKIFPVLKSLTR
jgi:hypothetical protein